MTLCDTGPIFAIVDPSQTQANQRCSEVLPSLSGPLVTTWPCLAEVMHLALRRGGWPMQHLVWEYVKSGTLRIHHTSDLEIERMQELMEQYADTPMDLADASLVAAAEVLNQKRVFSIDSDFFVYRANRGKDAFEVIPGPLKSR